MADVPLMNNPMTTAQDIIKGGASGAPARLAVGSNGDVLTVTAGAVGWAAPAGAGGGLVAYDINTYTAGNITNSNSTPTAVSGPTDLVVAASTGDLLNVGLIALVNNTTNVSLGFDFATIVSASPVNYLSSSTGTPITIGVLQWFNYLSVAGKVGGAFPYVVQSGDISGGNVTLRLYSRVSSGSRVVDATASSPLITWVQNLGQ